MGELIFLYPILTEEIYGGTPSDSMVILLGYSIWCNPWIQTKGRCAVVLPQGVLLEKRTEGKIREELIKVR